MREIQKVKVEAWIDPKLHRRAVRIAARTERSVAHLIRYALARLVEEEERKDPIASRKAER